MEPIRIPPQPVSPPVIEVRASARAAAERLAEDARHGLSGDFKELPPKYFYDERGSRLFEQITELAEYYPTRAERAILALHSDAIVAAADFPGELVELGSGSATKTRALLDAMRDAGCLDGYVPVDISEQISRETAAAIGAEYPGIAVHGVVCDFEHDLEDLPARGDRIIAFLGGTIGNFAPPERRAFLRRLAALMGDRDVLLLGTDLVKDADALELAYDDPGGVTAEFNKNVLRVLNRELGADFDLDAFEHVARFDIANQRIDIRLRSVRAQRVVLTGLDLAVDFEAGEEMRTELSCKFTEASLRRAYHEAGLELVELWTDPEGRFALSLARAS